MIRPPVATLITLALCAAPVACQAGDREPKASLDRMCAAVTKLQADPSLGDADRELLLAKRIQEAVKAPEVATLVQSVSFAAREDRVRIFRQGVEGLGVQGWSCPDFERAISR